MTCDLETITTALITSVGGTGAALAVAYFLGKKWLGTRIEESVKREYAKELKEYDEQRTTDKALFEKLLALLPSTSLLFLESFRGSWSYCGNNLIPLRDFQGKWWQPENRFLDNDIEQKRAALYISVDRVLEALVVNCHYLDNNPDKYAIPCEWKQNPEHLNKAISSIETAIDNVLKDHEELVSTARRILKC